ncbi:GNAT family N-acetyltransferase [Amycolatopsis sp. NPDC049252]|uniref:GNAT family N-acetyltransferase n=1 Tax=Amycolatopsis sp. NPDC049252 TaxID=3363933 RepID=UPI003716E934
MTARVRPATVEDAGAIGEIHVRSWQAAYDGLLPADFLAGISVGNRTAGWARTLRDGGRVLVVEDPDVVGFAAFGPRRDEPGEGELYAIYLRPEAWSRGLGRLLHEEVLASLTESGWPAAVLWVLATNERAKTFYERAGWALDGGTRTETIAGGTVSLEELRFRRPLP